MTEEQLWGVSILGGALVDKPPTDPRFQDDARFNLPGSNGAVDDTAGASTAHIGTMAAKTYDVTMRPKGVGSAVINPTEADQIIFGYDADGSGDVVRDWGGAAGAGSAYKPDQCGVSGSNQAALHLRAQSDISQVQHRKRIGSASAMALADGVDGGSGGAEGEGGAGLYSRSRLAQASQGRQVGRVTPGSGATRLTHRAAVGGAGVDHRGRAGKLMSSAVGIDRRLPSEPKSAPMCELKADGRCAPTCLTCRSVCLRVCLRCMWTHGRIPMAGAECRETWSPTPSSLRRQHKCATLPRRESRRTTSPPPSASSCSSRRMWAGSRRS